MLSSEGLSALGAVVVGGLSYWLAEQKHKRQTREAEALRQAGTERREHNFSLSVDERIQEMIHDVIKFGIKEGISKEIGGLRRQLTDQLKDIDVLLRDALGQAALDRELARKERSLTRAALEALTDGLSKTLTVVDQFRQWMEPEVENGKK